MGALLRRRQTGESVFWTYSIHPLYLTMLLPHLGELLHQDWQGERPRGGFRSGECLSDKSLTLRQVNMRMREAGFEGTSRTLKSLRDETIFINQLVSSAEQMHGAEVASKLIYCIFGKFSGSEDASNILSHFSGVELPLHPNRVSVRWYQETWCGGTYLQEICYCCSGRVACIDCSAAKHHQGVFAKSRVR